MFMINCMDENLSSFEKLFSKVRLNTLSTAQAIPSKTFNLYLIFSNNNIYDLTTNATEKFPSIIWYWHSTWWALDHGSPHITTCTRLQHFNYRLYSNPCPLVSVVTTLPTITVQLTQYYRLSQYHDRTGTLQISSIH